MGGNAIKISQPIHKTKFDEFNQIVNNLLINYEWTNIGSFGKKDESNDVDIVVIGTVEEISAYLTTQNLKFTVSNGLGVISVEVPFDDGIVQLDIMCSNNMEWSKWIYHYAVNTKHTGTERNKLLMATIVCRTKTPLYGSIYQQWSVILNKGIFLSIKDGTKVIERTFITNNPEEVCKAVNLNYNRTLTFEQILQQLTDDKDQILEKYAQYN